MRRVIFIFSLFLTCQQNFAQTTPVSVKQDARGVRLQVNGNDFFVNGMNWDYYPIGTNFTYNLWDQPDNFIKSALDYEMPLLKNMGVNSIRQYTGIPPKWVTYIYQTYGIYTMINHTFGRYGLTINGKWMPNTDYSNPEVQAYLLQQVKEMSDMYKNTPGVLMFLLGNENNYGLFWRGAETENVPIAERKSTKDAYHLYKLFNKAALQVKGVDPSHPVAICNGDLLFLDIMTKECKDVDVLGINCYRGASFGDVFDRVKKECGKPLMFTEFGADAYNSLNNQEDQQDQANYVLANWKEIASHAAGNGKTENCIGGFIFQFSDGWWKTGQTTDLDVHNTNATWTNGGYLFDYKPGQNNMNEEWFGICAKGPTNERGSYELFPRAAYYVLKEALHFNPYTTQATSYNSFFDAISTTDAVLRAQGDKAVLENSNKSSKLYLSNLRADFTTFSTGGSLITTPTTADPNSTAYPNKLGFDHMESFYVGATANPVQNMTANVQFNILGHVATNPIDEIFYENRGRPLQVNTPTGVQTIESNNRVQLYRASYSWDNDLFKVTGFYRTGHYHWGYEGDFFGLYPEANYGPNIDIYNGNAPFGFEVEGKKYLTGLKAAFGPELWWGANPALLLKYSKKLAKFNVTAIYHKDLEQNTSIQSSFAIPQPKTTRLSLVVERKIDKFSFQLGGLWAGMPLNGRIFQVSRPENGTNVIYQAQIDSKDNFGGKLKLTYEGGKFNWYGQGAAMGLVANGGADYTKTFTGWRLKDCGSGNQYNALTGFTYSMGKLQIAPNFLWQKPIEGPIPAGVAAPGRPRDILDDPFAVRSNRETIGEELLLTYDPTPATWFYDWDNDRTEDAHFAISEDFVFRHLPTAQDAAVGILADGRTPFVFSGSAPAHDLWENNIRIVSKSSRGYGFITNLWFGNGQANGSDARLIHRYGMDTRIIYKKVKLTTFLKFNDWGPYDYHRDFNLTYPFQLMADLSTEIGKPDWFILPGTKVGIRGTYRTLNKYSPRYDPTNMVNAAGQLVPDPNAIGYPNGNEWEIRTYLQVSIGK